MPVKISENQISQIWQHQLLDTTRLVTEDGKSIEIVYPGRLNDDRGGDFRDAVVANRQGLVKGDIEIHVKSGDWQAHQHHRDTAYNRVILHVVMWRDTSPTTSLQDGREIPILALDKYFPLNPRANLAPPPTGPSIPCHRTGQHLTADTMARLLERAGQERFLARTARLQANLSQTEAGQCLYQAIMEALGYSKNKLPCLELSRRLPLSILESVVRSSLPDEESLIRQQALLLGTAGLLPSQCQARQPPHQLDGRWVAGLEKRWAYCPHPEPMSPYAWQLFKVRPQNSPIRRLVAMSRLIIRYRQKGLLAGLVNLVEEVPASQSHNELEKGLLVTTEENCVSYTLLGRGRVADIIVNVLLPFTLACSRFTSRPEPGRKATELYHHYPRLPSNSIEKHMIVQLGLNNRLVNSARRQQGLIHIYQSLCTQGKCNDCQLGQFKPGQHV